MAIDNLASNESRLSGAYIRSLVKQLTTSKPLNTNENLINNDSLIVGEFTPQPSINTKKGDKLGMAKPNNNNQQQGHKKQVRRRLHTSRPYQERLLNMAEARKEIVTALKYHRASMKQARDHKQTRDEQHMDGHQQQLQQQHRDLGATTTAEGAGLLPSNGMDMMHPALDEVEMAAIRFVGEQHQMEWDDTLNLVKSAWWFKYLKTVDFELEFPPWLSANNDESLLQQHLDDSCSEDTTLPWMDIGDIDGMDDDWLS
uniref:Uncharacterized protein n=1 Tax=Chenopodium quinoa TaxID=63459 RepID=A0A803MXN3_CHEQI